VWHCHILSHEEMDMMRPISFRVGRSKAEVPVFTGMVRTGSGVRLSWSDGTPGTDPATWGNPANEVGYRIERAAVDRRGNPGAWSGVGTALANETSFTDATAGSAAPAFYRVIAFNAAGDAVSSPLLVGPSVATAPAKPGAVTATAQSGPQARVTWLDNATNEAGFVLERAAVVGDVVGPFKPIANVAARGGTGNATFIDTTVKPASSYRYRVYAINTAGASDVSPESNTIAYPEPPAKPATFSASATVSGGRATVRLDWSSAAGATGYTIQRATNATFANATTGTAPGTATSVTQTGLARNTTYHYRIRATNLGGNSDWVTTQVTTPR
jgi:hypothetical protein